MERSRVGEENKKKGIGVELERNIMKIRDRLHSAPISNPFVYKEMAVRTYIYIYIYIYI